MTKYKKLLTAMLLSAIILSASGCEISENVPAINSSSESSSVSESSSLPEEPAIEEPVVEEPIPEPVFVLSSNEVQRGSYLMIRAENIDLSGFSFTDFLGYNREFIATEGGWLCFVPVKMDTEPGSFELSFASEGFEFSETITVTDREINTQYLTVAPSTLEETLEDEAVRAAFDEFFQKYRWYETGVKFWEGEFVLPLGDYVYKETTPYGTFRTFSNGNTEWHNATDMAAKGGTPVYATNSGVILFADYLGLTGNTVIINHGFGVLSWHYHLKELDVSTGETVEKGDLIGKVGTTGLSTGNHLHFGITVGGMFVDPMQMVGAEPEIDFWKESEE